MYKQENKTRLVRIIINTVFTTFLILNGCASTNTGPLLSKDELSKLEEEIEKEDIEKNINSISDLAETAAKDLVEELKKKSYSVKLLSHLTAHSNGIYSHCTNVSTLAIHLAMKLGYRQDHVLENIGSAGLLHDIGKIKINTDLLTKSFNNYTPDEIRLLKKHPEVGRGLLLAVTGSPEEVRLIVYQHHECHDGSGYPEKLRGSKIYELTKILSIVNTFEHLFQGMKTREDFSIKQIITCMNSKNVSPRFDPKTLAKCLAILGEVK